MKVPSWAEAMVGNYKRAFKVKYEVDSKLTDEAIWAICNEVFDDRDLANQDNERVSEMYLREHG